jgi:hypothetical protein
MDLQPQGRRVAEDRREFLGWQISIRSDAPYMDRVCQK